MNYKTLTLLTIVLAVTLNTTAQTKETSKLLLTSEHVENNSTPDKVLHAEPLYIDLIRDLGARKGEREWNLGLGLTDNSDYDSYEALIEYEWAPMDRLGLEVELPFTFYSPTDGILGNTPSNKLNSIKVAAQWSFYVNKKIATSMAVGYINEFELTDFNNLDSQLIIGNVYNPFLVIAKRWGANFHSLMYTGPRIIQDFKTHKIHTDYDINTSFHYMIPNTRNFIGIEFNKIMNNDNFDMTIRPQMRLGIAEHLMIGIVAGIPVKKENERLSSFLRLIWEPKAKS